MHALVQLRELEEKYKDELVVIGVHSAKFMAEKSTEAIREAVLRYNIQHPVVNDRDFKMWDAYAVRAWPTMMFISPTGKVIGRHEGEVPIETFDTMLAEMITEFDRQNLLDRRPLHWRLEQLNSNSPLAFPGKVLADEFSNRLFIADTNHHRVILSGLDGQVQKVIGSGEIGFKDGRSSEACFNGPQGLTLNSTGQKLFVADTGNHTIRVVDLTTDQITTLAGTGEQGRTRYREGGPGRELNLNSPWDIAFANDFCYIAMAGFHQIWRTDSTSGFCEPWAGYGPEHLKDGKGRKALFAQPSGICYYNGYLYSADSETSAIRQIDLEGNVTTLVGLGLFEFGDVDGTGDEARLQHPLGVSAGPSGVYIADTYNNKIKRLDPTTRRVTGWLGQGASGYADGSDAAALFNEPGGLSLARQKLYIADTNNQVIRVADLQTGEVSTLELKDL